MQDFNSDDFNENVYVIRLTNGLVLYGILSDNETFQDDNLMIYSPMEPKERYDEDGEQYFTLESFLPHAESNILPFHRDNILALSKCNEEFTDIFMDALCSREEKHDDSQDFDEEIKPEHMEAYREFRNRLQLGHLATATLGRKH